MPKGIERVMPSVQIEHQNVSIRIPLVKNWGLLLTNPMTSISFCEPTFRVLLFVALMHY